MSSILCSSILSWFYLLDGLGGTVDGSFYKAPHSVNLDKTAGATSFVSNEWSWKTQVKDFCTLSFFFYSPNLVWFLLAALQWYLFPYDLSGESSWLEIFWSRLVINVWSVLLYFGYWHTTVELWCSRPFSGHKRPLLDQKVLHNIFYTTLGAIQWALTEVAFIYGYTTGRLSHETMSLPSLILWSLLVPVIRDFHFYFAHRFIHIRFLYKYVHSVHHRNTDTEPFSGLSMHPVEHLYYFTCYGPLLWAAASGIPIHPFLISWMGIHALLAPAASHSGYEDHWSGDLHHYLHHRYFECNYGSSGLLITDMWMGTLRERLYPDSSEHGSFDTKATLVGIPEEKSYFVLGVILPSFALWYYLVNGTGTWDYRWVSLLMASGPILAAALLHARTCRQQSLWRHYMAPFRHDTLPSLVIHSTIGGIVCCIWPVYSLLIMLLQN